MTSLTLPSKKSFLQTYLDIFLISSLALFTQHPNPASFIIDSSLKSCKITTFMTGPFLEINTFGVCKGEALKWLSNYLNIDVKETIASKVLSFLISF